MPERGTGTLTPDSTIGELLERWPGLEAVLVERSPHFQALANPVLRRTVAKVATLRQVSTVSGVPLGVLIERLRARAGLSPVEVTEEGAGGPAGRPAWAVEGAVVRTLDARAAIAGRDPDGAHAVPMPQGGVLRAAPIVPERVDPEWRSWVQTAGRSPRILPSTFATIRSQRQPRNGNAPCAAEPTRS